MESKQEWALLILAHTEPVAAVIFTILAPLVGTGTEQVPLKTPTPLPAKGSLAWRAAGPKPLAASAAAVTVSSVGGPNEPVCAHVLCVRFASGSLAETRTF